MPDEVRKQLAEAQQRTLAQARGELDAALAEHLPPLQQELAVCRKQAEEGAEVRAAVAEQFGQLPWQIQRHTEAAFRALQDQARAELERIIAAARSQDAQEVARRQALETPTQALQQELAQARETLESSMRGVHQRIQEPIVAAVATALLEAGAEISSPHTREMEALHHRGRMVADELGGASDLLRSERDATSAQLIASAAKREELQLWLAEQQAVYTQLAYASSSTWPNSRLPTPTKSGTSSSKFAKRTGGALRGRAGKTDQVRSREPGLNAPKPISTSAWDRCWTGRQRPAARKYSPCWARCKGKASAARTQRARAAGREGQRLCSRIRERAAEFQKTFHDALVERTGTDPRTAEHGGGDDRGAGGETSRPGRATTAGAGRGASATVARGRRG